MNHYELLFILPGTLTEDEAKATAGKVTEVVEKNGGTSLSVEDMGKSRLAYPMKHIRYGYFYLCFFQTEPKNVPVIEEKLRLMNQTLRAFVKAYDPKFEPIRKINAGTVGLGQLNNRDQEGEGQSAPVFQEAAAQIQQASPVAPPVTSQKTETKAEDVKIEDINKKLDEMLESDIANA